MRHVKNADLLIEGVAKAEAGAPGWAELRRRLGFEMNGPVLHEYYLGNLASGSRLSPGSDLAGDVGAAWGSVGARREDFTKTGVEQRHKASKAGRFTARFRERGQ